MGYSALSLLLHVPLVLVLLESRISTCSILNERKVGSAKHHVGVGPPGKHQITGEWLPEDFAMVFKETVSELAQAATDAYLESHFILSTNHQLMTRSGEGVPVLTHSGDPPVSDPSPSPDACSADPAGRCVSSCSFIHVSTRSADVSS